MIDAINQVRELVLSKTLKDTAIVFTGNVVSFVFGLVFTVLGARAVEPAGWGIFIASVGLMLILFNLSELGLSSGLFKFVSGLWHNGQTARVKEVTSVILTLRLASSIIIVSLMIVFSREILKFIIIGGTHTLVYLTAIGLIGFLLVDFQISLLQAKQEWVKASITSFITNILRVILLLLSMSRGEFSLFVLFVIYFLTPYFTFLISLFFETPKLIFFKAFWGTLKKVSKFSLWMGLNGTVGSISSKVDSILILRYLGAFDAGIVGAARQISNAVLVLVGSFATVIATRLSAYTGEHLKRYFKKTIVFSFILAGGIVASALLANQVISLFGPKYAKSSEVLRWLLFGLVPFALASPFVNMLIYAFHKPKVIAILSLFQLPLIILGNIVLIPKIGIYAPVVVIALWNISTLLVTGTKAKWELSHTH